MRLIICPNENCNSSNVIHNRDDFWYCLDCQFHFVSYYKEVTPSNNNTSNDDDSEEES